MPLYVAESLMRIVFSRSGRHNVSLTVEGRRDHPYARLGILENRVQSVFRPMSHKVHQTPRSSTIASVLHEPFHAPMLLPDLRELQRVERLVTDMADRMCGRCATCIEISPLSRNHARRAFRTACKPTAVSLGGPDGCMKRRVTHCRPYPPPLLHGDDHACRIMKSPAKNPYLIRLR